MQWDQIKILINVGNPFDLRNGEQTMKICLKY